MSDSIAIVGIGCLFPQAPDLESYWRNIVGARDCLSDVPADHSWSPADYYDADPTAPDKTWATRGGFLDKLPFDPMQFGIPPAMLESIDTTQLLSLLVAREALRDAGLDPDGAGWDRDRVGVIVGITGTQEMAISAGSRLQGPIWRRSLLRCGVDPALADVIVKDIANHFPTWTEQTFPGLLGNVVAGRIANRLDLGGTNAVVDAACASSLAAMQYAMGDLVAGRSDLVLTGGADTLNDIFMFECFTRTPAFTKKGDARPFDAEADGILIGEGIAICALMRLADAERLGKRIYAVIKGLGSSSDGRHKSIYAPNPDGQAKALRRTYAMAGIDPSTIELVEAHGTGTKAGDTAEITALSRVYRECGRADRWVALGSVKSQIGHTKSTAGAAGLVKAALALHQRVLPPTAKIDLPNPKMAFESSPFYLSPTARPWIRSAAHPRRAAVSAFGFGGSNFHAVLEEHGPSAVAAMSPAARELFLVGGDTPEQVAAALDQLGGPTLTHAARSSLRQWRPGRTHVVALLAGALEELPARVATAKARLAGAPARPNDEVWVGGGPAPQVAFVFPGQGSQYVEMGALAVRHPAVREALDAAETAVPGLAARIFPPAAWTDAERVTQAEALRATEWAQPALGAVSKGMADLLLAFGVRPHAVAGHSYGELVALHVAGSWTADALWTASQERGRLMGAGGERGAMAAVDGPLDRIAAALPDGVVLANRNHPSQGVISGARPAVEAALVRLAALGMAGKLLPVAAAFHSPLVADAREPFRAALDGLDLQAPAVPVISCATASAYPAEPDRIRDVLAEQLVRPVDWVGTVAALRERGVTMVVEVGPKGVLAGLVERCAPELRVVALDRQGSREDADTQLKRALAALAAAGVPVDVGPLLAEREPALPKRATGAATVWLAGANHRNPSTLEPSMPKLPEARPSAGRPAAALTSDGWGAVPSSGTPMEKPVHLEAARDPIAAPVTPTPTPTPTPASVAPAAASGDLLALLESTRSTLAAFQDTQARTAEVHAKFLDAFTKANDNFARLFEAQARLVERVAAGGSLPARAAEPQTLAAPLASTLAAPLAPVFVPPTAAPIPAPPRSSPVVIAPSPLDFGHTPGVEQGRVALPSSDRPAVASDLPPIFDARAAVEAKSAPAPRPAPRVTGLRDLVLAAVAAKTGYPRDALEPSMDLESDLGIDSIKRVEILSAVREGAPGLPEIDNDRLAALRTLDDVIRSLEGTDAGQSVPVTRVGRAAVTEAMLDAVASRTGYPRDALELEMDLESDLGIDSIKRVEILSAVRDAVPGLPEIDNERLSALRTLAEVVGVLAEVTGPAGVPEFLVPHHPPSAEALVGALLAAVAAKTGYPRDALELGMDLESDLGVDSIKRVEILSAVREQLPELPELDNEVLASLRTLKDVAEAMSGVAAGLGFALIGSDARDVGTPALLVPPAVEPVAPAPAPELPPVQSASDLVALRRLLRRRFVAVVPAPAGVPLAVDGPWVVAGPSADAIASALRARGVSATVDDGGSLPKDLAGVVASGDPRSAFLLAKRAGPVGRFATVSVRGGRFGRGEAGGDPLEGALAGLPKTLSREWPGCRCLALDVADDTAPERIAAELLTERGVLEVGLTAEGPVTLALGVAEDRGELPLSDGDLVVVTGGARGVTAACVLALSRRVRARFLLLGRTALGEEPAWARGATDRELVGRALTDAKGRGEKLRPRDAEALAAGVRASREVQATLAALGGRGAYVAVDGRDADLVRAAVREHAGGAAVRGVIHGAGVLADKAVVDKTPEQFDRVWSTKVQGWDALLAAVDPADLRFACAFTSVAGRFGNAGQADYAMANEALVHRLLALQARHPGCRVKACDWGPWDGGMVDSALKAHFEAQGHTVIPLEAGATAFVDELRRPEPEVVIEGPRARAGSEERVLTAQAPWLRDHVIGARPVLPVAMVIEWVTAVAREVAPDRRVAAVRDLRVLKGVVLDGAERRVTLSWTSDGEDVLRFELASDRPHYRASVHLDDAAAPDVRHPGLNGLAAELYPHAVADAYRQFLFHGPSLQGIDEVLGISDAGMVVRVRTSDPADLGVASAGWSTDPLALDAALQAMLLWVREKRGSAALPMALGEYRQLRPLAGPLTAHLRMDGATERAGRFEVSLVDAADRVVATISGGEYAAGPGLWGADRE